MSTYAALAHTCWVAGYDLGTDLTSMTLPIEYVALDDTRFGMTGRSRISGLESVTSDVGGYMQLGSGLVEESVWGQLSSARQAVTETSDGTAAQTAYMFEARHFRFQLVGGNVGDVAPFMLSMRGVSGNGTLSVGAVRGKVLKPKGAVSATGVTGSVVQVGAVGSTQYLYAVLHTFAIGTSFTLQIQSDDNSGMTSPTTRMTIGSITSTGGTWATRVAGPITDDWWRVNVSAASGTSTIAVSIGIK